jgi:hypothetical protein
MASHRVSIFGALVPDSNAYPEPLNVDAGNNLSSILAWVLGDTSADVVLEFGFEVPQNYVSAPKIVARFVTVATSGNVMLEAALRGIAVGESLDPTTYAQTVTSAATAVPGTAFNIGEVSLTFTAGNFAAGDFMLGKFLRKGSSGSDTLAADLLLVELTFEYADA